MAGGLEFGKELRSIAFAKVIISLRVKLRQPHCPVRAGARSLASPVMPLSHDSADSMQENRLASLTTEPLTRRPSGETLGDPARMCLVCNRRELYIGAN
jgi:hypothetical protein